MIKKILYLINQINSLRKENKQLCELDDRWKWCIHLDEVFFKKKNNSLMIKKKNTITVNKYLYGAYNCQKLRKY